MVEKVVFYLCLWILKKVEIEVYYVVELVIVEYNFLLIEWVMENIMINVVDVMELKGKIIVEVKIILEWVYIEIIDIGKGIFLN